MEDTGNLAYRGEGNCAIVFADLRTLRVYRLVKNGYTRNIRKQFHESIGINYITSLMIDNDVRYKLESAINYVDNIMDPLLSHNYAVIPELISVPKGFGAKAVREVEDSRPAQRKKSLHDMVDPDVLCALALPDCCFVRPLGSRKVQRQRDTCIPANQIASVSKQCDQFTSDICHPDSENGNWRPGISAIEEDSNSKTSSYRVKSDYSVQGCRQSCDKYERDPVNDHLNNEVGLSLPFCGEGDSDYFIIDKRGNPQSLHHLHPDRPFSFMEVSGLPFTLSIEIKPKKAFKITKPSSSGDIAQSNVCRFCMHKHLKRKSGKWPETSSYCPLDLFSGEKRRMKHALISLIKTPQNNLKICKNGCEVYGSDIRNNLGDLLLTWLPANPKRRSKLVSVFIDLIIETLLKCPSSKQSPLASKISAMRSQFLGQDVLKCNRSSFVHSEQAPTDSLPLGCVLERIQSIQALDTLDIEGIYPLYTHLKHQMDANPELRKKWCLDGPYLDESWLGIDREAQLSPESDEHAVIQVKRFLVSKTLQDCSIIVAIKPASKMQSSANCDDCLLFEGDWYHYSISLVDLEPKAFDKVETYHRQASEIEHTFAESSLKA